MARLRFLRITVNSLQVSVAWWLVVKPEKSFTNLSFFEIYSEKNFENDKLVDDFSGQATMPQKRIHRDSQETKPWHQKPEIVGFYLHCYPALIPERGVSAAGFSDQIRTGVFTKLYSFFQSICLSWFSCFWKQTSWVTFSVLFWTR